MNNEFFVNKEYENYINKFNGDMKLAIMEELRETEDSQNKKNKSFDKHQFDKEIEELEHRDAITENKKLLAVSLYDYMGEVMTLPMAVIGLLIMEDIKVRYLEFSYLKNEYSYTKEYFCENFNLEVKEDKMPDNIVKVFRTMPDIVGVELIYEKHPNEVYFFPSEYEIGDDPLTLEVRDYDDFDGVYSNNLCQVFREREGEGIEAKLQLTICKSNIEENRNKRR